MARADVMKKNTRIFFGAKRAKMTKLDGIDVNINLLTFPKVKLSNLVFGRNNFSGR